MPEHTRRSILGYGAGLALTPAFSAVAPLRNACGAEPAKPQPDPYADAVFVAGEPPLPQAGSFTIAVLPDTQKYAAGDPAGFLAQTAWIAENHRTRNIACALHLGDITDHNEPQEWELAVKAMKQLDGKVPYFLALGNHDYGEGGKCLDRTTRFNDYFPLSDARRQPTFGGVYDREPDRLENSYHLFSAGGRDFLVLSIEFGPRADVVRWANEVAAKYPERAAILLTHAYMYNDDTRYDLAKYGKEQKWNPRTYGMAKAALDDACDGEQLWQKLVAKHENFLFTINGHVLGDGLGRTVSTTPAGRSVHQMLVNFQMKPRGGDGWLRLLEFKADGRTIDVCDYSPTRNERNESPQNRFTLEASPIGNS